jgi:hypothetical protein
MDAVFVRMGAQVRVGAPIVQRHQAAAPALAAL